MTDASRDLLGPQRELDLTPERLPRTLWLAAGIPVFTAALLFWLSAHWQQLSYRGYTDDPDWLWRRNAYETMVRGILSFLVFEMWLVIYGLAHWYGSARTSDRDARFIAAIANAWCMALLIPAIQFGVTLDLSWRGIALCLITAVVGYGALVIALRRTPRKHPAGSPQPGAGHHRPGGAFYFDRDDPALVSPRGINLGNPWQWALIAAGLLPSAVTFLLLQLQRG